MTPEAAERTRVVIVGAGPAGLLLGNQLLRQGIDCVLLEARSRSAVESTPQAGFLEEWAVRALRRHGYAGRLLAGAARHSAFEFRFAGRRHPVPYAELTGHHHYVCPQQFLVTELAAAYVGAGGDARFQVADVEIEGIEGTDGGVDGSGAGWGADGARPVVSWTDPAGGVRHRMACDFVAGCDGPRGVGRALLEEAGASVARLDYGVGWLALLAETPPAADRVMMGIHPRGFAAHMPRTAEVTRFYLQCAPGDRAEDWPDERVWAELQVRLAVPDGPITPGPLIEKRVLDMHNYVVEPPSWGRLFLAGDAAHLVAPIGAKGLNLALHDALHLAEGFTRYHRDGDRAALDRYPDICTARAWEYQEFSQWLSEVYHGPSAGPFQAGTARARLRRVLTSRTAATAFAELYIGAATEVP